jgi:hypothetical protein
MAGDKERLNGTCGPIDAESNAAQPELACPAGAAAHIEGLDLVGLGEQRAAQVLVQVVEEVRGVVREHVLDDPRLRPTPGGG